MEANIMDIASLVYKLAEQPAEVADAVIAEFEATKGERSDAIRAIAKMAAIIRRREERSRKRLNGEALTANGTKNVLT